MSAAAAYSSALISLESRRGGSVVLPTVFRWRIVTFWTWPLAASRIAKFLMIGVYHLKEVGTFPEKLLTFISRFHTGTSVSVVIRLVNDGWGVHNVHHIRIFVQLIEVFNDRCRCVNMYWACITALPTSGSSQLAKASSCGLRSSKIIFCPSCPFTTRSSGFNVSKYPSSGRVTWMTRFMWTPLSIHCVFVLGEGRRIFRQVTKCFCPGDRERWWNVNINYWGRILVWGPLSVLSGMKSDDKLWGGEGWPAPEVGLSFQPLDGPPGEEGCAL